MSEKPKNPPAFPHVSQTKSAGSATIYTVVTEGISLRDWFAGQALAGMLSGAPETIPSTWARQAYLIADEMLTERERGQ